MLNTINGMAWDLSHVRFIEQEFALMPTEQVRFAIHVLLTFDNGLKEILQINPVEQIVIYKETTTPKLKYSWLDKIQGAVEKLFSEENRYKRQQTLKTTDIDKLRIELENELLSLCNGF